MILYYRMRKILIILCLALICTNTVYGVATQDIQDAVLTSVPIEVFAENNKFGLKSEKGDILVKPVFKKLIKVGNSAWLCQKGNKFGLIDASGDYLVKPKYDHADRMFGKYAKLGNERDYGLYDEKGTAIIQPEYSSIEPLWGGMFLTCKNYKYGVLSAEGKELLANHFDNIYMPERDKMRVKYAGQWYEISELSSGNLELPEDVIRITYDDKEFAITKILTSPVATSGYSVVSATNYFLKIFSVMSPSYEQTIDELMYSQGADSVNIIMNFSWIPKFPVTYIKKYYSNIKAPNNGPLNDIRDELKNHIK